MKMDQKQYLLFYFQLAYPIYSSKFDFDKAKKSLFPIWYTIFL